MVENEEGEFHVALMNAVAESLQITPSRPQFPDADEDDDYLDFVDRILFAGDTVSWRNEWSRSAGVGNRGRSSS